MTLCVDIGNTRTKVAVVVGGRALGTRRVSSAAPVRELAREVARAARGRRVERAMVSSVRPDATARAVEAIRRATGLRATVVTHRTPLPVAVGVQHPGRLGTDRLCAACGAMTPRRRSVIVVDAGSAVTVDLIVNRRFLGGVILAGPGMALSALHRFTAQLPSIDFAGGPLEPRRIDDTESAMRWGAVLGSSGGIRAAVEMLEVRAGKRIETILTGGDAARLRPLLPSRWRFQPDLTLIGLAAIARGLEPRR